MGLLDEYSDLLSNIHNLSAEIPQIRLQIRNYERMLTQLEQDRANLDIERSRKQSALFAEEVGHLVESEKARLDLKKGNIQTKLQELNAQHNNTLNKIKKANYSDELEKKYLLLNKMEVAVNKYNPPTYVDPQLVEATSKFLSVSDQKYSEKAVLNLIAEVQTTYHTMRMNKPASTKGVSKVLDYITLKQLNTSKASNQTKLWVYLGYLAALCAMCITIPVLPIALVGGAAMLSFSKSITGNKNVIEFILPYTKLSESLKALKDEISSSVEKLRQKELDEENSKFKKTCDKLQEQLFTLEEECTSAENAARSSISQEEINKRVEMQYASEIESCNQKIADTEKQIKRQKMFIASNEEQIPMLKEQQKILLEKIKELYLNPSAPGTSRRLTKSFFLGINEKNGTLIEFKFDGKTTLIMYKGASCRSNKDLISMMLMQLLSSMSLTTLSIYLTDLSSAGSDYAVFFQPQLSGKLHMCATNDDIKSAIEDLHNELIMRTGDILTEAESLEAYNEQMLSRKSLPREYIFFLFQDPTDADMQNQKLVQLLLNGPTVGIIPIVFLQHTNLTEIISKVGDKAAALMRFFDAFGACAFTFDGTTSDLAATPDLSSTIISMIKKGAKK